MNRRPWLLILSILLLVGCTKTYDNQQDSGFIEAADSLETFEDKVEVDELFDKDNTRSLIQTQAFLRAELLDEAMREVVSVEFEEETILGGIVPHHDVSYQMMGRFYKTISQDDVDLVVLVGPNHFGTNDGVLTYDGVFSTFLGEIETDTDKVNALISAGLCLIDQSKRFELEHSLNIQMPFVVEVFEGARVLPILIGEEQRVDVVDELVTVLDDILMDYDGRVMVIGTVDFSHYLDSERTQINDSYTLNLIEENNTQGLMQLDDGYVDAPSVLTLMMKLFEHADMSLLEHTNAEEILEKISPGDMTSYMTFVFHK